MENFINCEVRFEHKKMRFVEKILNEVFQILGQKSLSQTLYFPTFDERHVSEVLPLIHISEF